MGLLYRLHLLVSARARAESAKRRDTIERFIALGWPAAKVNPDGSLEYADPDEIPDDEDED